MASHLSLVFGLFFALYASCHGKIVASIGGKARGPLSAKIDVNGFQEPTPESNLEAWLQLKERRDIFRAVEQWHADLPQYLPSDTNGRDAIVLTITGEEAWCRLLTINALSFTDAMNQAGGNSPARVDIIAMHSLQAKDMSQGCRRALRSLGLILIELPAALIDLGNQAFDSPPKCGDIKNCWSKFLAFTFTSYRTVMFLDADTLALKDPRPAIEMFRTRRRRSDDTHKGKYDIGAVPDLIYAHLHTDPGFSDIFNSGVMVFEPSLEVAKELFQYGLEQETWVSNGDNGLLCLFFALDRPFDTPESRATKSLGAHNWLRLPATYNINPHLFFLASAGHSKERQADFIVSDLRNIAILHFVWPSKRLWSIPKCYEDYQEQYDQQGFSYSPLVCKEFHSRRIQADALIDRFGGLVNPVVVGEPKRG
jgi:hypothetical protein